MRPGNVEPHSVVECLYACREGLDFGDLETLGSGMKVHSNHNLKFDHFTFLPITQPRFLPKGPFPHFFLNALLYMFWFVFCLTEMQNCFL